MVFGIRLVRSGLRESVTKLLIKNTVRLNFGHGDVDSDDGEETYHI